MEENNETQKSANQIWRESGTTLSFSEWLEREKAKGSFIPNKMVADTTAMIRKNIGLITKDSSYVINPKNNNTILGLNKWILLSSLMVIGGAIAFSVYKNKK
jgi:alkyl hydroperoxide reductase subunit AhpC